MSIGEDGPSQMALEDLSMTRGVPGCAVLYPCDAVSTERLVVEMGRHAGMAYMRTSRPKTPVIYGPDEAFPIGGSKVLRQSANDVAAVVGAGITVFEALKAYDQLKAEGIEIRVIDAYSVQPIDAETMIDGRNRHGRRAHHGRGSLSGRRHRRRGQRGGGAGGIRGAPARGARDSAQRAAGRARRSLRHLGAAHRRRGPPDRAPAQGLRRGVSGRGARGLRRDREHALEELPQQLRALTEEIEQIVAIDAKRQAAAQHVGGSAERLPDSMRGDPMMSPARAVS